MALNAEIQPKTVPANDQNAKPAVVTNSIRDIEETVTDVAMQKRKLEKVLDKTRYVVKPINQIIVFACMHLNKLLPHFFHYHQGFRQIQQRNQFISICRKAYE